MEKEKMLVELQRLLLEEGFEVGEPMVKNIIFDLVAKRDDILLIIKALTNIDALRGEVARELKILANELEASPMVVGRRSAMGDMMDGVVYFRHGIPAITPDTFQEFVKNGEFPMVYASPGGFYVNINREMLRRVRMERGLSLGQLAKVAGVSRKTIQLYEEGMSATIDSALRLEEYLNAPLIEPINILRIKKFEEERGLPPEGVYDEIYRRLMEIGYDVFLTLRCPFEALSKDRWGVFLTGIREDEKRIKRKATTLKVLTEILGKDAFIVVNESRYEESEGIALIEKSELMEVERAEEIRKIVRERSAL
jgi:putative transcriptional regulator